MTVRSVIIIGSGPAGWTAGLYASRAGLLPLLFEGEFSAENQAAGLMPMGQLSSTTVIENYPGFPSGNWRSIIESALDPNRLLYLPPSESGAMTGPILVELMRAQAIAQGLEMRQTDIISVNLKDSPFTLLDSAHERYQAKSLIIATGASAKYLGLPSEAKYFNKGVSSCAVCDGALPRFRDKPLSVIGGGDTAAEEALYLCRFASKVYLVHRRDSLRASQVMKRRIASEPKIELLLNQTPEEILGNDQQGVTGLRLQNTLSKESVTIEVSGVFLAIGHRPNTAFLNGQLSLTSEGFIERPIPFRTNTSLPGVFAAGDVADPHYRQAVTAAASGCMAALDAEKFLQETSS